MAGASFDARQSPNAASTDAASASWDASPAAMTVIRDGVNMLRWKRPISSSVTDWSDGSVPSGMCP